ncbi:MAG: hypothetical protein ACOH1F_13465 [Brevundimonas sp.]
MSVFSIFKLAPNGEISIKERQYAKSLLANLGFTCNLTRLLQLCVTALFDHRQAQVALDGVGIDNRRLDNGMAR